MLRTKKPGGPRRRPVEIPDNAMGWALMDFLAWSETIGATTATILTRKQSLIVFVRWCVERSLTKPTEITLPILERYQRHLFHYRKSNGEPLGYISQRSRLVPVKTFFQWLTRSRHILYNPASELQLPRPPKKLPHHVLTLSEVEAILAQPDITTPQGLRDRAMLELLYSTGVRRMELTRLKCYDVDTDAGSVFVREGKGRKDRMIPIGQRACAWLIRYLHDVRPELVIEPDSHTLFLADYGEPLNLNAAGHLTRRYIERAGYTFPGSCHLFRHAMATHMLENGADIRYIQAMLGHAKLTTTEIYTQVSILKLKQIHNATHPARMARAGSDHAKQVKKDVINEQIELLHALAVDAADDR
jgi:integrase/recombinase XerD